MTSCVGFVGLGNMGKPMVKNLLEKGESVIVYDKDESATRWLYEELSPNWSICIGTSHRDLRDCDIVLLMLPDSNITNLVMLGGEEGNGLIESLKPGATVFDMGSSDPSQTVMLSELCATKDMLFFDAPVSGSVIKAEAGNLTIMIGSQDIGLNAINVLKKLGSDLIRTGEVGSAHAMKALNNYVYAAGLLAVCESIHIAERMGLDVTILSKVLKSSSGRNVAIETKLDNYIIPRSFKGGFSLGLQSKDLLTATSMANKCEVNAPLLSLCDGFWKEALSTMSSSEDNTSILQFVEYVNKDKSN